MGFQREAMIMIRSCAGFVSMKIIHEQCVALNIYVNTTNYRETSILRRSDQLHVLRIVFMSC